MFAAPISTACRAKFAILIRRSPSTADPTGSRPIERSCRRRRLCSPQEVGSWSKSALARRPTCYRSRRAPASSSARSIGTLPASSASWRRDRVRRIQGAGIKRGQTVVKASAPTPEPRGELTVRLIAMPRDTNANGDIFGGWVLSQMDQAGGIAAAEKARGRVVTIAIEAMTFIRPVKVGDVLCVYTAVDTVGRTSLKIHIEAWARRFRTHHREKVTDATFTFVAIDEAGRPRPTDARTAKV